MFLCRLQVSIESNGWVGQLQELPSCFCFKETEWAFDITVEEFSFDPLCKIVLILQQWRIVKPEQPFQGHSKLFIWGLFSLLRRSTADLRWIDDQQAESCWSASEIAGLPLLDWKMSENFVFYICYDHIIF